MGKTIDFNPFRIRKKISDVEVVIGMFHDNETLSSFLYKEWRTYFMEKHKKDFFDIQNRIEDIIDDAFVVLHSQIKKHIIYVEDGVLCGRDGKPFRSTLITYLYSVAGNLNKENVRDSFKWILLDELFIKVSKHSDDEDCICIAETIADSSDSNPYLYTNHEQDMLEIISECILLMSQKCKEVLTKFYYKEKSLDMILSEDANYSSKNALKTEKNKCMNKLKQSARSSYLNYLNS